MAAAILRLPPELLADIFLSLTVDAYDAAFEDAFYVDEHTSGWILVSHVCTQWRNVALSTPTLWSYFKPKTPSWLFPEFLTRSKEVPLYVSLGDPWDCISHAPIAAIAQRMPRVRELKLVGRPKELREACDALSAPAPILHKLVIICTSQARSDESGFGLANTPVLRHLEVQGIMFDWAAWKPSTMLTTLVLTRYRSGQPSSYTMAQLIAALEQMPHLKALRLKHVIPSLFSTAQTPLAPGRVCSLNNLQDIELEGTSSQCASLLLHLSFPLSAATFLSVIASGSAHLPDLRETLAERVIALPPPESLTIHLSRPSLILKLFPGRAAAPDLVRGPRPSVEVLIGSVASAAEACAVLGNLLPAFVDARRVRITMCGVGDLPVLLEPLRRTDGAALPLPCLREFALERVAFERPQWVGGRPSFEGLRDWLMERCAWDVPVETLRIERCYNFQQEDYEALGEIVVDVQWDGEIMYLKEE